MAKFWRAQPLTAGLQQNRRRFVHAVLNLLRRWLLPFQGRLLRRLELHLGLPAAPEALQIFGRGSANFEQAAACRKFGRSMECFRFLHCLSGHL